MSNKRWTMLVGLVVVLALVAGCGAAAGPTATSAPAGASLGTVKVGTEAAYPPFENKDENGNIVGFDIDLLKAIAANQGFAVEFVDTPFDGIFVALQSGQFGAVISAATITDERKQIVNFSDPYFEAGLAVVVMADSSYQVPDDLKDKPIGVQLGTTGDIEATARYGEANVQRYDDVLLAFQALINGDVEGVVNDLPVTKGYMAANPDTGLRLMEGMLTSEQYGIAVNKDKGDLLTAINAGLAAIRADGTYDKIFNEWITSAGE